ncbi:MAG TPA: glutamine amidotransferase [Beutenbergiaceae bacterium]|nr:glutamine amidotransferase [Beutenbergiaceae bacterium]
MKPFLFITTRDEDEIALADYGAFLRYSGLTHEELEFFRLDLAPLPNLDLEIYSGIILGGSPFNVSDEVKGPQQQRIEADLDRLISQVLARDFPFFGACFGIGVLGTHLGAVVDGQYSEPVSAPAIRLSPEGAADPLLEGIPHEFRAYVGHKEALSTVPAGAVVLAGSDVCPIQMFRVGRNVYATQFHPELDIEVLTARVYAYLGHGYIDPEEAEDTLAELSSVDVDPAHEILAAFVDRYQR